MHFLGRIIWPFDTNFTKSFFREGVICGKSALIDGKTIPKPIMTYSLMHIFFVTSQLVKQLVCRDC